MNDSIREALAELVALDDLKGEESRLRQRRECSILRRPNSRAAADAMRAEYNRRKPLAWAAARAALSAQPAEPPIDAFPALRALTEAILTRADADYMQRQLDEAVRVMALRGCSPPVPYPTAVE